MSDLTIRAIKKTQDQPRTDHGQTDGRTDRQTLMWRCVHASKKEEKFDFDSLGNGLCGALEASEAHALANAPTCRIIWDTSKIFLMR